jgi:two-component system, LytTR family, response regulator
MKLRAVLVDDEPLARSRMRDLLSSHASIIRIVAEAGDTETSCRIIADFDPDVVFLDIDMPGGGGFEVLDRIEPGPAIVFVTAYAEYAVQAFRAQALDYLLKPVESSTLTETIQRLQAGVVSRTPDVAALKKQHRESGASGVPGSIPVRTGGRFIFVPLQSVIYFEARDKYVIMHTEDGQQHVLDHTILALASKLPSPFLQVHRRYIVNLAFVREVRPDNQNRFYLRLKTGKTVDILSGPTFAEPIKAALNF